MHSGLIFLVVNKIFLFSEDGLYLPISKRLNLYCFRYCVPDKPIIGDLDDVAKNAGNLKILIDLFNSLNMNALKKWKAVTIFAPSDEAFKKLPAHTLQSLTNNLENGDINNEWGKKVLGRHIYQPSFYENTTLFAADIAALAATTGYIYTYLGERLPIIKSDNGSVQIYYNGKSINIVTADIQASNGVIHIIDQVIINKERCVSWPLLC